MLAGPSVNGHMHIAPQIRMPVRSIGIDLVKNPDRLAFVVSEPGTDIIIWNPFKISFGGIDVYMDLLADDLARLTS